MTILTAMQRAAIRLIGRRPDAFFGAAASNVFEMEISDLVNEVATDIVDSHDWQALTKFATITADGTTTAFDMPTDYDRMLMNSEVSQTEGFFWGYEHVTDLSEFQYLASRGFFQSPGVWTIYGNQMHFSPAPTIDGTYPYVAKCYARDSVTLENKCDFDADTDEFLLDEKLLTLGLVWRWREQKKMDATGDQEAFAKALGEKAARDSGSKMFRNTGRRWLPGTHAAWPWQLG